MKEVTIRINKETSATTVETKGFSGPACLKETGPLEAALGVTTTIEPTPEMQKKEVERERRRS